MKILISYAVNRAPHLGGLLLRDHVISYPVDLVMTETIVEDIRAILNGRELGLGPVAIIAITKLEES